MKQSRTAPRDKPADAKKRRQNDRVFATSAQQIDALLNETAYLLHNPKNAKRLLQGIAELE